MVYKNLVPTSQKTQHVCIKNTDKLMRFKEINTVFCENHTGHVKSPSVCKMRRILAPARLYPWKLGGSNQFGRFEEKRTLLFLPRLEYRTVQGVAQPVTRPATLSWLQVEVSKAVFEFTRCSCSAGVTW